MTSSFASVPEESRLQFRRVSGASLGGQGVTVAAFDAVSRR